MASNSSEGQPFLGDSRSADHDDGDDDDMRGSYSTPGQPARVHFQRALQWLTGVSSFVALCVAGLMLAVHIYTRIGPFERVWDLVEASQALAIGSIITSLLHIPSIFFLQIPYLLVMATNVAMAITTFILSGHIFGNLPQTWMCRHWEQTPASDYRGHWVDGTPECIRATKKLQIVTAVGAALGIVLGLLLLSIFFVRLVALVRTRFWVHSKNGIPAWRTGTFAGLNVNPAGWNPTGFTLQFTISLVPVRGPTAQVQDTTPPGLASQQQKLGNEQGQHGSETHEHGRLIET